MKQEKQKTKAYTKTEFLAKKFCYSTYENILKIAFTKKGKGFYISWVVEGLLKHYGKTISTKYLKQFIDTTEAINELIALKDSLYLSILRSSLTTGEIDSIKLSLKYDEHLKAVEQIADKELFNKMFDCEDIFYVNKENLKHYDIKKEHYKIVKKWISVSFNLKKLRQAQTKKVSYLINEYGLKSKRLLRFYKKEVFTKQRKTIEEYDKGFNGKVFVKNTHNVTTGERFFKVMREIYFVIEPKSQ